MIDQEVILFASGDLRRSANLTCWPAQQDLECYLTNAFNSHGLAVRRGHPYKPDQGHGFLASQREGMDAFADIDPDAPIRCCSGGLAIFAPCTSRAHLS